MAASTSPNHAQGVSVASSHSSDVAARGRHSVRTDSGTGWGASGGYNFTNRLAIQFEASAVSPRYRAVFVPEDGGPVQIRDHTAGIDNVHIKGTFYLLPGRLTPLVEAGLGWSAIDSNILAAPPITGCWFDPWWGYRCNTFYSTYGAHESS